MTSTIRNRRPKKQHDAGRDSYNNESSSSSSSSAKSFLFSDLLPVPLRNCLSGQEPKRKGSIIFEEEEMSSAFDSVPMLRRSVCSNETAIVNNKGDAANNNNNNNNNIKSRDISSNTTSAAAAVAGTVGATTPSGDCQSVSDDIHNVTMGSYTTVSSLTSENMESEYDFDTSDKEAYSFLSFRLSYLFVTLVVMLADGLQGK